MRDVSNFYNKLIHLDIFRNLYRFKTLHKKVYWKYEIKSVVKKNSFNREQLVALNGESTLDLLLEKKLSFARFGEGELRLAFCQSPTIYEKINTELAKNLRSVLLNPNEGVLTGFNHYFLESQPIRLITEFVRDGKHIDEYETLKEVNDIAILHRKSMQLELSNYWNYISIKSARRYFGEASVFSLSIYHDAYTKNQLQIIKNKINAIFQSDNCLLISPNIPQNGLPLTQKFSTLGWRIGNLSNLTIASTDAFQDFNRVIEFIERNDKKFDLVILQGGATATVLANFITKRFRIRAIDVGGFTN
jgi:hypothetical protein